MTLPGPWEEKCWGKTRCLIEGPLYSRHELVLRAGGFCSFHYHRGRANRFRLLTGRVRIVWAFGWHCHSRILMPGDQWDVPSRVPHQFQVLDEGSMLEEYYPDCGAPCETCDIERLTTGGLAEQGHLEKCPGIAFESRILSCVDLRQVYCPDNKPFRLQEAGKGSMMP